MVNSIDAKTIKDFGEQWTRYPDDNSGYYASKEHFADIVKPLLGSQDVAGKYIAEIGAGTGRIVHMLMTSGAQKVLALEPSDAVGPLKRNVAQYGDRVEVVHASGEQLPKSDYDLVVSIGVIQHVSDPDPILRSAYNSLKPGGKLFLWLYAKEGTEVYRAVFLPIRAITRRLPNGLLNLISWILTGVLSLYIECCKLSKRLPLSNYMVDVLGKVTPKIRMLTVYDQLNPTWVRYYSKSDLEKLMMNGGFTDIKTTHRHGYSWSVVGTKQ